MRPAVMFRRRPLLLVLLPMCLDAVGSTTYVLNGDPSATRATTPLAIYDKLSLVKCGTVCARHVQCRHWQVSNEGGFCKLWPAASAENPAQIDVGPVYGLKHTQTTTTTETPTTTAAAPALPACYDQQVDGVAFCVHSSPSRPRSDRAVPCQADDPRAQNAFVDSAAKVALLRQLTTDLSQRVWVDMQSTGEEHAFADGTGQRSVQVAIEWMYNGAAPGAGCARFQPGMGIIIGPCSMGSYGSICEIRL